MPTLFHHNFMEKCLPSEILPEQSFISIIAVIKTCEVTPITTPQYPLIRSSPVPTQLQDDILKSTLI